MSRNIVCLPGHHHAESLALQREHQEEVPPTLRGFEGRVLAGGTAVVTQAPQADHTLRDTYFKKQNNYHSTDL